MKKLICLIAVVGMSIMSHAAEPSCVATSEFWGKRYAVLTTVTGVKYKVALPKAGEILRVKTKTGWYMIDSNAKIVKYSDPAK